MHSRRLGILDETRAYQERRLNWPFFFVFRTAFFINFKLTASKTVAEWRKDAG